MKVPDAIYEVVAQGARYWFLFLMLLIAWRSYRWYRRDSRKQKQRKKLLPDAGYVGEMAILRGGEQLEKGSVLPVPFEGTLGTLRTNDLPIPLPGVERRHLWFAYEERDGLCLHGCGQSSFRVDGIPFQHKNSPLYMAHGSTLLVGDCEMRLRLFAGFESTGYAPRRELEDEPEEPQQAAQPANAPYDQAAYAAMQQQWLWQQQQVFQQQQAYQQGYWQAMQQMQRQEAPQAPLQEEYEEEPYAPQDALPFDMAQMAQQEGLVDHRPFMRPESASSAPVAPAHVPADTQEETLYPLETEDVPDDADDWPPLYDEDMTDAAAPPKSAYVGRDDAEVAKRLLWDKYLGGGTRR